MALPGKQCAGKYHHQSLCTRSRRILIPTSVAAHLGNIRENKIQSDIVQIQNILERNLFSVSACISDLGYLKSDLSQMEPYPEGVSQHRAI